MINALHGLMGRPGLAALGNMELFWDFMAPVSYADTAGSNTIDGSGGYDSFTRAWDFSGKGRHGTVFGKASAPRYSASLGAQFLGAQWFQRITDATPVGTIFLVIDPGTIGAFKIVGTAASRVPNNDYLESGYIGFGNVTSTIAGETFSVIDSANTSTMMATGAAIPAGFNVLGIAWRTASTDYRMTLNGAEVANLTTVTHLEAHLDWMLGRRQNGASSFQYFSGSVRKALIYSTSLGAEGMRRASAILV